MIIGIFPLRTPSLHPATSLHPDPEGAAEGIEALEGVFAEADEFGADLLQGFFLHIA